jgi:hypothetical protein
MLKFNVKKYEMSQLNSLAKVKIRISFEKMVEISSPMFHWGFSEEISR